MSNRDIQKRAKEIKLLIMDIDGVLTDGTITVHSGKGESKGFFIPDGVGITLAHRAGLKLAIISARPSKVTDIRMKELKIKTVKQVRDSKLPPFLEICKLYKLSSEEIAYIGDDMHDIPVLSRVGLAISVNNAAAEAKSAAHYVTKADGGRGAVREAIELILKSQKKWKRVLSKYFVSLALSLLLLCSCGHRHPVERLKESEVKPPPAQKAVERVEKGFSFTSTEKGVIVLKVKGESASRNAEGTIELESPQVSWYGAEAPVTLKAQEGTFDERGKVIQACGDVFINSAEWGQLRSHSVEWSLQDRVLIAKGEAIGKFYIADR